MKAYLPVLTGLLLIVVTAAGALEHGRFTNRWNQADQVLTQAAKALGETPVEFGPWRMQSEEPFSERIRGILDFANALNRVYVNEKTGQTVAMAIIVGPPGPTSTHTAEICYSSKGYELIEEMKLITIDGERGADEFRKTHFQSVTVEGRRMEVLYSWRQGEHWTAPLVPRASFGGKPYLFKIQVASNYDSSPSDPNPPSACKAFLSDLLPVLDRSVFADFKAE